LKSRAIRDHQSLRVDFPLPVIAPIKIAVLLTLRESETYGLPFSVASPIRLEVLITLSESRTMALLLSVKGFPTLRLSPSTSALPVILPLKIEVAPTRIESFTTA